MELFIRCDPQFVLVFAVAAGPSSAGGFHASVCCFPFGRPNSFGVQKGPQTQVCVRVQESILQTVYLANCTKYSILSGRIRQSKAAHIQSG